MIVQSVFVRLMLNASSVLPPVCQKIWSERALGVRLRVIITTKPKKKNLVCLNRFFRVSASLFAVYYCGLLMLRVCL